MSADARFAMLATRNEYLAMLGTNRLAMLEELSETVDLSKGEIVYAKGDTADFSYIVVEGAIDIVTIGADGEPVVLEKLGSGGLFGLPTRIGRTLLRRCDTAQAVTPSRVSRIACSALEDGEQAAGEKQTASDTAFAETSSLAQQFPAESFGSIPHARRRYAADDVILRQGERADEVFIIEAGSVDIFKEEDGRLHMIGRVEKGGFFGERGVLRGEPRAATVITRAPLSVMVLDGAAFREQVRKSPKAEAFLSAVESVYQMPQRGLVVQGQAVLGDIPAATSYYTLLDGRNVLMARATDGDAVIFRESPLPASIEWLTSPVAPGVRVGVDGDRLVAFEGTKDWPGLENAATLLLDGELVDRWSRSLFQTAGLLRAEVQIDAGLESEIMCGCMGLTRGNLRPHLSVDSDIESLVHASGATTGCGSCRPRILRLLGRESVTPVRIAKRVKLAAEIDSFRLVGIKRPLPAATPGQHVVLEGLIDDVWVTRSYTITGHEGGEDGLEIAVLRESDGLFSNWLFTKAEQGSLRAAAPAGELKFAEEDRPIVFIAGGIGITPAIALARGIATNKLPPRPLSVFHSARSRNEAAYADELGAAAAHGILEYTLWETSTQGRVGAKTIARLVGEWPSAIFMICGSEAFERTVSNHLASCGISGSEIVVERFIKGDVAPARERCPVLPPVCPVGQHIKYAAVDDTMTPDEEAELLVRQYHWENGLSDDELAARLADIEPGKPFEASVEEITFAAKLSWRNSSRCVGRLYWNGLAVRDARHVNTPEGVLEEMAAHLAFATNEGRIRSAVTVFPAVSPDTIKIVSPQLARYAGYLQSDGSVIGDPSHIELTVLAEEQGWRGAREPFDILPLMVQDPEGRIHHRAVDRSHVMEVELSHPDFGWFTDLGYRWHVLPAISNVCLAAFGRIHPIVMNGWYMGTEIGGRNLSDPYRYNVLPTIAKRMGIDRSSEAALWRDRAMVELNIAVLHSFRKAGVTVLDHHTASREFLEFIGQEHACGRVANTDWAWVVPPISGSATPQFHIDFPNAQFKPAIVSYPELSPVSTNSTDLRL